MNSAMFHCPRRIVPARSIAIVLLALTVPAFAQQAPNAWDQGGALTTEDRASIQSAHSQWLHSAVQTADGFRVRNAGQQWTTSFDASGFLTRPNVGDWTWGLELQSYGRNGADRRVPQNACLSAEGTRVQLDWGAGLTEWFVNDSRGLEHGFTLLQRPRGETGSLRLDFGVCGSLVADVFESGRGSRFCDAESRSVLTYSGLIVFDAKGVEFPARFTGSGTSLQLTIDDHGAEYPLTIDPIAQQAYLKASNTSNGDLFGVSVAVSGETVVIGADREDSSATGVNGDQTDDTAFQSGAAYVFERENGLWSQVAYLKASNTESNDGFGNAVGISGNLIVVAADNEDGGSTGVNGDPSDNSMGSSGAVYVFERSGGVWGQVAYLKASNTGIGDQFGGSLAISGDRIAVAALQEDSADTGVNANQTNNNALRAGSVYVFERNAGIWSQRVYLKASNTDAMDWFGVGLDISGETVVVGALAEESNATGINGDQTDNSAHDAGAVYVFAPLNGIWRQQAYIKASNTNDRDNFGFPVAIDGNLMVVGAFAEKSLAQGVDGDQADNSGFAVGAAYVFERVNDEWSQVAYLKASNSENADRFGVGVAISGEHVVVGADREDSSTKGVGGDQSSNGAFSAGAAYSFRRANGVWSQDAYLKASNTLGGQDFGRALALSDDLLVVGASGEASNAMGVNGDQSDTSANDAGAAYLFDLRSPIAVYCDAAGVNSTGQPGVLSSFGSVLASDNAFGLRADQLPTGVFGYFLNSPGQDYLPSPGGAQGPLCLGGGSPIGRHYQTLFSSGNGGVIESTLDLTAIPTPTTLANILAGDVWNFQCWYRDQNPTSASNFTNALSVQFE